MKALVTGAAGFIGSHIAEALCRRGAKVIAFDDLSAGGLQNLAWSREGHPDLEFVQRDVTDKLAIQDALRGCDWVFHEAAVASVPFSVAHPRETNEANLTAALQLLIAAREAGVKRFVFASSSAIYGDSDAPIKHEAHAPDPLTPYALQKFAAERYARMFHHLYGLPTVSLRYFNVFGPRQSFQSPYSGVIARFCTAMLGGEPPTIFGDGLQSRDFVYIDNVVSANLLAVEEPVERVAGGVFNIGGGESITLLDLVAELNRLTGQQLKPRFESARAGDVRHSRADISAARRELRYEPSVTWQEGLGRTLNFYKGQA
jgi:nucleoside-diphosphate-sugar epimerase